MEAPAQKSAGTTKRPNRPPIPSLTTPIGCLTEEKRREEKRSKREDKKRKEGAGGKEKRRNI